ncbi:hypothetical protein CLAFUW4_10960 [Fulvia fulva]|uniref:BTB domain-containing protein n=1 Tax=Passalora fulva TaxID=5499 RepID=A0A9Q8URL0_PASFU|nr:uncharacterized protein CLAFUR5_10002 [Fulvia fulva]KAK4620191.1 hypothetical protein CLAFUR4_10965 [Fulvia fulva]KAK4620884.1 hypothetical protein CLAFUR0_10972 [Fulvia fulva]UJO19827.1 hypothetical protein CLAFUR5_10002 [Fulvia fulva]WPV17765.1 hypothetical protein CLAFUW4_10960 [Fulvia fulva]WPV32412.1 hypothetical protein CLAFUW7_10958 [Fulvia fulva]
MAPSNGIVSSASHVNGSKRPAAGKVVPAIPLALSKRSARPQPKPEIATKAVETNAKPAEHVEHVDKDSNALAEAVPKADEGVIQLQPDLAQAAVVHGVHSEKEEHEHEQDQATNKPSTDTPVSRGSAAMETSNGATPQSTPGEAAAQEPDLVNGQTEASSPTIIASPVSRRKTSDRFDMRQIMTGLPPVFVPSAGQHTPHSASSSFTRPYPPPGLAHGHPTHPSASSIVFGGGQDSASSSPAPPLSAGSAYAPPPQAAQPPFFAHAHHPSDPPRMGPPNGFMHHQSPMQRGTRQGFVPGPAQPYHPHAHMPRPHTPRDPGRQAGPPFTNGHGYPLQSRSASQASSIAYDVQRSGGDLQSPIAIEQQTDGRGMHPDQKAAFSGPGHLPAPRQHMGPPPPPTLTHPAFANDHNALAMRDHLYSHFESPELADCHLQISDETSGRRYFDGHKIILARSPTLLSLIRGSAAPTSGALKTQVTVPLQGQHVAVGPFFEALRFLYGGPLPDFDPFRNTGVDIPVDKRLDLAFKYIATGAWLDLTAFAHRGVEICSSLLHWETIPSTLAFTLDGGLGQMWPTKDGPEDGNEEKNSTCSSDDSFRQPEAGGAPRHDPYSSALLHRALDYMVHQFPPNFYLDQSAPQLASTPRLPTQPPTHESKPSRSDPRLSSIRFGDISAAEDHHQRPSHGTTNISSILLSLPFPLLKFLLEHPILTDRLGPDTVSSIMRQVVGEREARRQKALLQTRTAVIDILYWEELVEPYRQNKAGFRLTRRRRGINTPPSSNESDKAL